jgi:hypothetical protein
MKPADSQIDVLLARHGQRAKATVPPEHLDADEINTFAEGSAPAAARARYVAHLADCDDCRKLATRLVISAGSVAKAASGSLPVVQESLWQKVTSFFATPTLRYAAFAAVVIAAIGVTFIALRQKRESTLVATSEAPAGSQPATTNSSASPEGNDHVAQMYATPSQTAGQPEQNANRNEKQDESRVAAGTLAPPKAEKEPATAATNPIPAERKSAAPSMAEQRPSYAPPPPGEAGRVQSKTGEETERDVAGTTETRRAESQDKLKAIDRSRAAGLSKDEPKGGPNRSANNQQMMNQNTQSSNEGQSLFRVAETPKGAESSTAAKPATAPLRSDDSAKAPETRSVRGHKFRRQGNAWIDVKFKSSMAVINVARGSDEFRSLNSELRSITEQLGGEVIVVKSGKAYRIK